MRLDEERIRASILNKLHNWLQTMSDPDSPIIGVAGEEHEAISPRQIVLQVEQNTEEGEQFVQRWVELAVEHIMDSELDTGGDEPIQPVE